MHEDDAARDAFAEHKRMTETAMRFRSDPGPWGKTFRCCSKIVQIIGHSAGSSRGEWKGRPEGYDCVLIWAHVPQVVTESATVQRMLQLAPIGDAVRWQFVDLVNNEEANGVLEGDELSSDLIKYAERMRDMPDGIRLAVMDLGEVPGSRL